MARIFRKYETEKNNYDDNIRIKCSSDAKIVFFDVTEPCEADDSKEDLGIDYGYLSYTTKETDLPESEWYEFNGVKIIPEQTENMLLPLLKDNLDDINFKDCKYITQVDFANCGENIGFINVSNFFEGCSSLEKISGFQKLHLKGEHIRSLNNFFNGCSSLQGFVDLSFNDERCMFSSMDSLFENCENLTGIRLGRFYNIESINRMCFNCKSLKFIDLSEVDLCNVRQCKEAFKDCENLEVIDISTLNPSYIYPINKVYDSIGASGTESKKETNYENMFKGCKKLRYIRCNAAFKAMIDNNIIDHNASKTFSEVIGLKYEDENGKEINLKDNIEFHVVW